MQHCTVILVMTIHQAGQKKKGKIERKITVKQAVVAAF